MEAVVTLGLITQIGGLAKILTMVGPVNSQALCDQTCRGMVCVQMAHKMLAKNDLLPDQSSQQLAHVNGSNGDTLRIHARNRPCCVSATVPISPFKHHHLVPPSKIVFGQIRVA